MIKKIKPLFTILLGSIIPLSSLVVVGCSSIKNPSILAYKKNGSFLRVGDSEHSEVVIKANLYSSGNLLTNATASLSIDKPELVNAEQEGDKTENTYKVSIKQGVTISENAEVVFTFKFVDKTSAISIELVPEGGEPSKYINITSVSKNSLVTETIDDTIDINYEVSGVSELGFKCLSGGTSDISSYFNLSGTPGGSTFALSIKDYNSIKSGTNFIFYLYDIQDTSYTSDAININILSTNLARDEYKYLNTTSKAIDSFIAARSFSLGVSTDFDSTGSSTFTFGTCWVLGQYTTWDSETSTFVVPDSYTYWVATNLHVDSVIEKINTSSDSCAVLIRNVAISDSYPTVIGTGSYTSIVCSATPSEATLSKVFGSSVCSYTALETKAVGNDYLTPDFAVFKMNFDSLMDLTLYRNWNSFCHNINSWITSNPTNYHLSFPGVAQSPAVGSDTYLMGYPVTEDNTNSYVRTMKKHTKINTIQDLWSTNTKVNSEVIYSKNGKKYFGSGLIYTSPYNMASIGGSSGSMVLNSAYQLVGLNFAQSGDSNNYAYYLSVANNYYNLIDNFYNKTKG